MDLCVAKPFFTSSESFARDEWMTWQHGRHESLKLPQPPQPKDLSSIRHHSPISFERVRPHDRAHRTDPLGAKVRLGVAYSVSPNLPLLPFPAPLFSYALTRATCVLLSYGGVSKPLQHAVRLHSVSSEIRKQSEDGKWIFA